MRAPRRPFVCAQCQLRPFKARPFHSSTRLLSSDSTSPQPAARPNVAPKPNVDIKSIRQNPSLYEQNCLERNYKLQATYPARINQLHQQWQELQQSGRSLRERANHLRRKLTNPEHHIAENENGDAPSKEDVTQLRDTLLAQARDVKTQLSTIEESEEQLKQEIENLALAIPNLTSDETPRGDEPRVLSYINAHPESEPAASDRVWRSHVHIGSELGILDFGGAATTTGWGWYFLLDAGAQLEQALVQFALATATRHGWRQVSPPSIVYSHIAGACGFQPRDQHGETQIYALAQSEEDRERGKPELSLAGTAEIPIAGMKANSVLEAAELPLKRVGVSRSYRAEAGARGAETKGLYRVHEFTKVEMFAWAAPDDDAAIDLFDEMVDIQTDILHSLGLHCRVLEMPSTDLGASAVRKCDIEAFFPSRRAGKGEGWGEVTSASICTDYQARRLATRLKDDSGKLTYPWTVNGTALAVPRVLAAILETGWDEKNMEVVLPECLAPWMDGRTTIGLEKRRR